MRNLLFLILLFATTGNAHAMMDHGTMKQANSSSDHCAIETAQDDTSYDNELTSFGKSGPLLFMFGVMDKLFSDRCMQGKNGMRCHKGKNSPVGTGMGGCCLRSCSPFSGDPLHGGILSSGFFALMEPSMFPDPNNISGRFFSNAKKLKNRSDPPLLRPPAL